MPKSHAEDAVDEGAGFDVAAELFFRFEDGLDELKGVGGGLAFEIGVFGAE